MQTHLSATFIYIISLAIKLPQSPHYGSPHFSKVPAFSQVGEARGRLLSASVKSQLPLAESNPYAKVTYFKVYILIRATLPHNISIFHSYIPYMFSKFSDS